MTSTLTFRLSDGESLELAERVATLAAAQLPLAEGLRAAAADVGSRRLSRAFLLLADEAAAGKPLQSILAGGERVPAYVAGLVAAALRTGRLPEALNELIAQQRASRELFRGVLGALAYPATVLGMLAALVLVFELCVMPDMGKMMRDFEIKLPIATEVMIRTSDLLLGLMRAWPRLLCGGLLAVVLAIIVARYVVRADRCSRWFVLCPVLGPLWHWTGGTEFCRLTALLVEQELPLPVALRLAAGGVWDPNYRTAAEKLAGQVEAGTPLPLALTRVPGLPRMIAPFAHWGEQSGSLAGGLRMAADVLAQRATLRAEMYKIVLPPCLFWFAAVVMSFMFQGSFGPLVSLVENLAR